MSCPPGTSIKTPRTFSPSSNGTKNGVICVGASNTADSKLSISNFGTPVDILAPGDEVRTRSVSATSDFVAMTGTSAAAALVAGSVLAELSINGSLTPDQVETAIKASAIIPASGPRLLRTTYASAVTITITNPDAVRSFPPPARCRSQPPHHRRNLNPFRRLRSKTASQSIRPKTRILTEFRTWLKSSTLAKTTQSPHRRS